MQAPFPVSGILYDCGMAETVTLRWLGGPLDGGTVTVSPTALDELGRAHLIDRHNSDDPALWSKYVAPVVDGQIVWYQMIVDS